MAFNTTVFSTDGLNLLSQLSSTKSLRVKNIYVDEIEHAASDFNQLPSWWASQTSSTMAKVDAELSAASVISDQARLIVKLRLKQGKTTTVNAKTIVITACGVESGVESTEITFFGVSDSAGVEVLYNTSDIKLSTSIAIYFAFNNTSEITFKDNIDPDFVIHSELDRFVSCHPVGDPTGGENQTIGGIKTFKDGVVIDIADSNKLSFQYNGEEQGWIGDTGNTGLQFMSNSAASGDICFKFSDRNTSDIVTISRDGDGANESHLVDVDGNIKAESIIATTLKGTSLEIDACKISRAIEGGLSINGNFTPNADRTFYLGRPSYRWKAVYGDELRTTAGFVIDSLNARNNELWITEDEGDICFGGLLTGHGLMVGQMYDTSTQTLGERGPIYCGKMYGSLVTTAYKPTEYLPTIPNSTSHTANAPSFISTEKMIVMAIPCWATCCSLFLNRRSAGETITVNAPTGAPPYTHSGTVSSDPENGAWFVATWKCGKNSSMGHYEPLSTMDLTTDQKLFSYLPAGQYRLLNCVDEITSLNYADYNPNGMCFMLQRV